MDVYIGYAYSENFNYDVKGDSCGYLPDPAMPRPKLDENKHLSGEGEMFWKIFHDPNAKVVDWGCCVIKMSRLEIIEYLTQEEWSKYDFPKYLAMRAKELLKDDVEYVLAAMES